MSATARVMRWAGSQANPMTNPRTGAGGVQRAGCPDVQTGRDVGRGHQPTEPRRTGRATWFGQLWPCLLVIGLVMDGHTMFRTPTLPEALGLGYLVLIVTTAPFLLGYSAMPRLGPDRAGLFAGVIPIGAITPR
jgi:hypothetical protein